MLRAIRMLAASLAVMSAVSALAQDYPARPVKIIVPFAAGGPADIYARFLDQRLELALAQPFVVDDRPGAGSVIGTNAAAKSAPDGYTLLLMSNAQTVNESLVPSKPYALLRDFVPVAPINYSDLVLVVHPGVAGKCTPGADRAGQGEAGQAGHRLHAGNRIKFTPGVAVAGPMNRGGADAV